MEKKNLWILTEERPKKEVIKEKQLKAQSGNKSLAMFDDTGI